MKKIMMIGIAALASVALAQELSLADASSKAGDAASNPATMTALTKQLGAADQVAFLARVNQTIDAMPGSAADKAATYLNANTAALKGAAKGNVMALLAEVFATVPPEALTVINESFAANLFNRTADATKTYTDEEFVQRALAAMADIQKRNDAADNAGVRDTFAVLMFLRASNGSPADLANTLTEKFDAKTQELARNEWIPPALNDRNYDPMLGAAGAGEQPEAAQVLRLAGPQVSAALLADLSAGDVVGMPNTSSMFDTGLYGIPAMSEDNALNRVPRTMDKSAKYYGGYRRGDTPSEPDGYMGQRIK